MIRIALMYNTLVLDQSGVGWITVEQMKAELEGIYEFALRYPTQGLKGPHRTVTVQSKQTFTQQILSETLGLNALGPAKVGKTKSKR